MIRSIIKDPVFLSQSSARATAADRAIADDLRDTLFAHRDACVGMAANMIGEHKRVIIFLDGNTPTVMFNPEIVSADGEFETEEGCLSLTGTRHTKRCSRIRVRFQDERFVRRTREYEGWTAQIIQHEIDHCNGVLI